MNFRDCRRPNSRPYGLRTKKVKVAVQEFDVVAAVAVDSDSESEHIHIAESNAGTDTAIIGQPISINLHCILHDNICH